MSTINETTNAPAGFTHRQMEDDAIPGAYFDTWDGPSVGGVRAYWAPDQGVILAVDGYQVPGVRCQRLAFDVPPSVVPSLASDLLAVARAVELAAMDAREDVRETAQRLNADRRATVTDVFRDAQQLGIPAADLMRVMDRLAGRGDA